ncbi:MAG: ABC transporter substrate-binding protein [Oscillospiraceae bacterium]
MNKLVTKIISLIMAIMCIGLLFACDKEVKEGKEPTKKPGTSKVDRNLRLPFSQEDTLNPYVAKSQINQNLTPLIYSSLFVMDNSHEPQPQVAHSGTVMGLEVSVNLNSDKRFADGSYITAQDVVFSFNLAKQSVYYSQSVINIASAKARGSQQVEFTLVTFDAFALSCLDFPIVKSGTAVDGTNPAPVASGKYTFNIDGAEKYLEVNKHNRGFSSKSPKIELVNITDSAAIIHSLVIGNIDSLFCNLSGGKYERINAGTREVLMNNFVFLGINPNNPRLADPALRQAISAVIDREKIINEGLQGFAEAAYTPFNPKWYALGSVKQPGKDIDTLNASKYIQTNAKRLSLRLVVNSENELKKLAGKAISECLGSAGISVNVVELPFDAFNATVASGGYDLYLGEMKLTDNMNIYPLINPSNSSYAFYLQLLEGTITMQNFIDNFYSELPFIPICYKKGVLAFSRHIAVEVKSNENDVYANIGEWYLNN